LLADAFQMLGYLLMGAEGQVGRVEQIIEGQLGVDGQETQPVRQLVAVAGRGSTAVGGDDRIEVRDIDF
jgi:hypothetical protein